MDDYIYSSCPESQILGIPGFGAWQNGISTLRFLEIIKNSRNKRVRLADDKGGFANNELGIKFYYALNVTDFVLRRKRGMTDNNSQGCGDPNPTEFRSNDVQQMFQHFPFHPHISSNHSSKLNSWMAWKSRTLLRGPGIKASVRTGALKGDLKRLAPQISKGRLIQYRPKSGKQNWVKCLMFWDAPIRRKST